MKPAPNGFAAVPLVAALALVALLSGAWWYFSGPVPPAFEEPVACTADALQCPDGTYVGRTGPDCEFVCPGESSGILPYQSGIRGTVMLGPTCPVETNSPQAECADKPYQTLVAVFRASDLVHAVAITTSDEQGHFEVSLPPDEYMVGAGESAIPVCAHMPATVVPSGYTSVTVLCDSSIR